MILFAVLLIAVVVIALVARSITMVRSGPGDSGAWLAGNDGSPHGLPEPPIAALAGESAAPAIETALSEVEGATDEESETSGKQVQDEADPGAPDTAATTADGWDFTCYDERVELVQVRVERMHPGDFVAARVRQGEPDLGLWIVDALGRSVDSEAGTHWPYREWVFTSEAAANAALRLLQREVVRPLGPPRAFTDADFDEARRLTRQPEPDSEHADSGQP